MQNRLPKLILRWLEKSGKGDGFGGFMVVREWGWGMGSHSLNFLLAPKEGAPRLFSSLRGVAEGEEKGGT